MSINLNISKNLALLLALLFAAANAYLISKEIYYQLLIPVGLVVGYAALVRPANILLFIGLTVPFSRNLSNIRGLESLGIYFPTEPLLIGLSLLFILSSLHQRFISKDLANHKVSFAMYFMLFWILVTSITSTMPVVSFKFFASRIWFVLPLFFMATEFFRRKEYIRKYFSFYTISLAIVVIITLIRHSQFAFSQEAGHWAMNPYYKDHTSYGAVLALLTPFLIGYSFGKVRTKIPKTVFRGLLVIFAVGLVFSYTRAAWLSLVVAGGVFLIMKLRIKFYAVFIVMITLIAGYINFQDDISRALSKNRQDSSEDFMEHIRSMTNISTDASNLERLNRWNSAIAMFQDKPVFGFGPGTYMFQYAPYQRSADLTIISTNSGTGGNAHSEYIGPLSESGLFGALYFVLILVTVLYTGIKRYYLLQDRELKMLTMAAITGIITYAAHGFLNNFLDTDKLSYPFWGLCALIVAIDLYHRSDKKSSIAAEA